MAIQKTTMKRYNGTEWEPVYLANSADITYLGNGFTVTAGDGFTVGQAIAGTEDMASILAAVVNNLTKVDKVTIPTLVSGEGITALAASKLTGVLGRDHLPADVGGKGIEVATEEAKAALTSAEVNVGDIVKVTGGKVYMVNAVDPAITYLELTDNVSEVAWARVTGTPTTLAGYGITDAVNSAEKVTTAAGNAGKILVLNADGKLDVDVTGDAATLGGNAPAYFATAQSVTDLSGRVDGEAAKVATLQSEIKAIDAAWITTGTIDIARLPASAIETMYVAENEAAIAALTTAQVQNGDTIKNAETGAMFFVVDDTKLGTGDYALGLVEYTAGVASSVDWSGVLNKPTTLDGYGITDAVNASEKVATAGTANAGKILTIGADGKLDASITGDAATLGGNAASYYAVKADTDAVATRVGTAEGKITALEGTVGNADSGLVKDVATLKTDMTTAQGDIASLKTGEGVSALAATKITGTMTRAQLPADISGRLHKYATLAAAQAALSATNASVGDLVKLDDGKVYVIKSTADLGNDNGYEVLYDIANGQFAWAAITGTPTTLAGYGITDAVAATEKVTVASAANANKILVLNAEGKMDVSITGDAATLGGNAPAYYAVKADTDAVAARVGTAESDIDTLQAEIKAIDAAWITTGKIDIERLPHGAMERCVVVANDAARFALTADTVQTGDTVKVTETGKMYFVVDDAKLAEEAGYEVYTAGTASSVDWSGVQNKPTTLAGYGITDAVASNEKVTEATAANAGKILVLNAEGKLDASITGNVEWANVLNKPTSSVADIDAAVAAATHTNRAVLDKLSEVDGVLTYNGAAVAMKSELDAVSLGALSVVDAAPADAKAGQLVLESIV